MKRLLMQLQQAVAMIDAGGVIGIGLTVFAAAVWFSAVVPAQDQLVELQKQPVRQQRDGAAADNGFRSAAMRGADQLEKFNRHFPGLGTAPVMVLKLHEIAAQNSITLDTGEYRLLRDRDATLSRYQVTLPLRGTYWQVRLFVAQVLDELPASALEEIAITRDSVSSKAVETRVRFTLYLGDGSGDVKGSSDAKGEGEAKGESEAKGNAVLNSNTSVNAAGKDKRGGRP